MTATGPTDSDPTNGASATPNPAAQIAPSVSAPPPILTSTATVPVPEPPPPGAPDSPMSMIWRESPADAVAAGELSIIWTGTAHRLAVGAEAYAHDGVASGISSSHGVARLLLAVASPAAAWRPIGDVRQTREAEFNTSIIDILLDMVLASSMGSLPPDQIPQQMVQFAEWMASLLELGKPREGLSVLFSGLDDAVLVRLSPIYFERRKNDRRNPDEPVAFRFRADQSFEGAGALQSQLVAHLVAVRELLSRADAAPEVSVDVLVFQAWMQPDQTVAAAARSEIVLRLRQAAAANASPEGVPPPAALLQQLNEMMSLVAHLYTLVKPSCRLCARPATRFWSTPTLPAAYGCDDHSAPSSKDLPGADAIRAAAFLASQLQDAPQPVASAPSGSVSNGSVV